MLAHFLKTAKGINDHVDAMIDAINFLQDRLTEAGYKGAFVLSLHERKAGSEDVGDSDSRLDGHPWFAVDDGFIFKRHKTRRGLHRSNPIRLIAARMGELDETIVDQ